MKITLYTDDLVNTIALIEKGKAAGLYKKQTNIFDFPIEFDLDKYDISDAFLDQSLVFFIKRK